MQDEEQKEPGQVSDEGQPDPENPKPEPGPVPSPPPPSEETETPSDEGERAAANPARDEQPEESPITDEPDGSGE